MKLPVYGKITTVYDKITIFYGHRWFFGLWVYRENLT